MLSKGRWAGEPLVLMPWQIDFIMRLFSWRAPNGRRRFRRAYLEIGKKNGKSSLISALSLYMLLMDGEGSPECYINACDKDQASIIYEEAARMVEASPSLRKRVTGVPSRKVLTAGHGRLVANSSDAPKQDGLNPHLSVFDELHRQPSRQLWDVFCYASVAREQPLFISATTAGEEESGPWHEQREYSEQVTAGIIQDPTHLGVVYRASESDDPGLVETWQKANPVLGVILSENDLRAQYNEAIGNPANMGNFLRLRLNIVARGQGKFMDMHHWAQCSGEPSLDPDLPLYGGLDLSEREDLSALVLIQGSINEGINVFSKFWLPADGIAEKERRHGQPYRQWANEGMIDLTPGETIDRDIIEAKILELSGRFNIVKLSIDQRNATDLSQRLLNQHGLPIEYLRQGFISLNDPTKTLLELAIGHKIRHGGNDILKWHMSNAVASVDAAGNFKLDKKRSRSKIDGASALVNAVAAMIATPIDDTACVYDVRGGFVCERIDMKEVDIVTAASKGVLPPSTANLEPKINLGAFTVQRPPPPEPEPGPRWTRRRGAN